MEELSLWMKGTATENPALVLNIDTLNLSQGVMPWKDIMIRMTTE